VKLGRKNWGGDPGTVPKKAVGGVSWVKGACVRYGTLDTVTRLVQCFQRKKKSSAQGIAQTLVILRSWAWGEKLYGTGNRAGRKRRSAGISDVGHERTQGRNRKGKVRGQPQMV